MYTIYSYYVVGVGACLTEIAPRVQNESTCRCVSYWKSQSRIVDDRITEITHQPSIVTHGMCVCVGALKSTALEGATDNASTHIVLDFYT